VVRNPSPIVHALLALLVLLVAMVLAVYKPQALTPYGQRKQREQRMAGQPSAQGSRSTFRANR
jgi:heme exporter protein D